LHGLLDDVLQAEMSRLDPEDLSRIHARASDWWEVRGSWQEAVCLARTSGDIDRAAALMIGRIPEHVFTSGGSLGDLVNRFDDWQIRSHRGLAVAKAWTTLAASDSSQPATWAAIADAAPEHVGDQRACHQTEMALHLLHAMLASGGCESMRDRATLACDLAPSTGPWVGLCSYVAAMAAHVSGDNSQSTEHLERARRLAGTLPPALRGLVSAQLALIVAETSDRPAGSEMAEEADAAVSAGGLADEPLLAMTDAVAALLHVRSGSESAARLRCQAALRKADADPGSIPWLTAVVRTVLARTALHLGDGAEARTLLADARMTWRSGLADGAGLRAQIDAVESALDSFPTAITGGRGHLTPAELRVLRLLPTHLSFRQMGAELFLSRHTVKTEAISAYRKLGVTSRAAAVTRARELGLL
jgi:LuxR family maltose regulon positive regulatory protein